MNTTIAALVMLLLVAASNGGRANRQKNECTAKCSRNQDSIFKLGKSYTYSYRGESEIKTSNGTYDSTGVLVKSKVTIVAISNCQMKLTMSNVEIFDKVSNDGNKFRQTPFAKEAKEVLEKADVLFTRSGEEVTSLCVNKNEPVWSQNMKKSIVDILANNGEENKLDGLKKTRHGMCYVAKTRGQDQTMTLSYDLQSCKSPSTQSLFTDLTEAVAFEVSQVKCKYAYKNTKDPNFIHCTEEYDTTTLRRNGNQVQVRVTTRLERVKGQEPDMSYPKKDLMKTGIQMKIDPGKMDDKHLSDTKATIDLLCDHYVTGKRSEIPKTFMTLVNQMKKLTSNQMKDIYILFLKTDICPSQKDVMKTVFYDAVGFVNTPAATSIMVDLIKNKQISEIDQAVWFTSLSFMKLTPTLDMIKDLESLLQTTPINKPMFLGISAVTHLYCKVNQESCLTDSTVTNILNYFLKNIGKDCSLATANDNLSNVQISLKSLGNLKLFTNDVVTILSKCVASKSNPIAIRVSALDVMKHMDCQKDRSAAMDILENIENDSELRIHSYLAVMGCPNIDTMFKVREILLKEKVNQVGSFIWTHLTNIQESNDLLKDDIKLLLRNVELKKEFDISKLKFSRNIEKTFSTSMIDLTMDSNIIFSEKSFIPRSLSINTTTAVLGRPTNLIEISGRMEGVDELLFKLLGPEGYLKKKDTSNSAADNMNLIKMLEEVNGNLNFKLFGQQISFVELIRGSLSSVRKYNIIEELLKFGEGQTMEMRKNLVLLDSEANIPTSLGFPLKFKVQGSVAVAVSIKSKFDITGLMKWPVSLNVESNIAPSVMSEFSSQIIIETPYSDYGMSMQIKSGTDTEFKAIISASKNEDFQVKFDTPKTKQEIVTVSGKSFVVYRSIQTEQLTNKLQTFELCSQEKVERIFGVKVCANAQIVDTKTRNTAILYGPFSTNVYIEKLDTQTGYMLKGLWKSVPYISETGTVYNNKVVTLEFDTPQSKLYNRRFALEMVMDYKNNVFKLELDTPWKQALLKSTFTLTNEQKDVMLICEIDRQRIVQVGAKHQSLISKMRQSEKGILVFRLMDLKPFETTWEFVSKKDEWNVKFVSKGLFKDETYLKMNVKEVKSTRELELSNKYKVSGAYKTFFGNGHITGVANSNYYGHRWDITVKHTSRDNPKDVFMVKYSHKTEDKSSKSLLKYFLTSTISYGENAENFVKFKIENELSKRHVRTTIKTNYGIKEKDNLKSDGEIDLQLYGGYTWKDNDIHNAEGSLSFKFPKKGMDYEGRYTSEVGRRLFKLSVVLDENQKSKVNLKLNYAQPKLYLKDTEFDLLFSIPGTTTNVNWALTEVDVNKYKYSFVGKYNKYAMTVDGTQTEISRLKYDSSVKISMPSIKYWPEKVNIDIRMDFLNPANSILNGKVEIPNTDHKYSIDLKFSSMPQNFMQQPITDKSSVFRYEITIGNVGRTIKSKSIFTFNPEEVQLYFKFAWDTLKYKDEHVMFNFHTSHKSPNYKQFDNTALIAVQYPGNSHSIGFKSKFKYSELESQIDIMWNRYQKISILTTYEIDNNWTEMGLKAAVTVKTPFPGLESTYLGINAIGQLRYRKVDIEFKWAGNKKILFDIVVHPRSSNDFTLSSKLVTPFQGVSLISLQALHISTRNSIKSEAVLDLGPIRQYNIKFEGINNSEGKKRDFGSTLQLESGIFPPLKLAFAHKDDTVHFKSQLDVDWMKTESINIKNEFSYTFEDKELITNGVAELHSTIEAIKSLKATWSMENKDSTFINNVQFFYKSKNIFHNSIKGYFEKEDAAFKLDFSGFMRIATRDPLKVTNLFKYDKTGDITNSFSLKKDTLSIYSHTLTIKPKEIVLKMLIVDTEFKTVEFKAQYESNEKVETRNCWLKIGEKYLFKKFVKITTLYPGDGHLEIDSLAEVYSDFLATKTYKTVAKLIVNNGQLKLDSVTTDQSSVLLKYNMDAAIYPHSQTIKMAVSSKFKHLSQFEFDYKMVSKYGEPYLNQLKANYNDFLKLEWKLLVKEPKIEIEFSGKYNNVARYFKFKYDQPLQGYEQLLETNLFGTKIKVATSVESRGGTTLHTSLTCNLPFLKSLDVVGRFSRLTHNLDIVYKFQKTLDRDEIMKLSYSKRSDLYNFDIATQTLFSSTIKLNLNQLKKLYFDFRTLNNEGQATMNVKFDYEGGYNSVKHSNEMTFSLNDIKFQLENRFEKVNWSYLLLESKLKTNIQQLNDYKFGFQYKQHPSTFEIDSKVYINERFVKLATNFKLTSNWKTTFKLETSHPALREIIFHVNHKQNKQLTQVTHGCEISLISNERKFQIKHKLEWSSTNYILIESSIVAKTAQDTYFIRPNSFKIMHQLLKNTLTEVFEIRSSDWINVQANLELPLDMQSRAAFVLNLSKQFKMDISVDLTSNGKKSVKFSIDRNMDKLINIELFAIESTNKMLILIKVDEKGRHSAELEIERPDIWTRNCRIQVQSTLLTERIEGKLMYNIKSKESSVSISGIGKDGFTFSYKLSENVLTIRTKYGTKYGNFDLLFDEQMFEFKSAIDAGSIVILDIKMTKKSLNFKFLLNKHFVTFSSVIGQHLEFDVNVLNKIVYGKLKTISTDPYKYELVGKTNFLGWSRFTGEVYVVNGPVNLELTSRFSKEDNDLYNILIRKQEKSFQLKYETILEILKSGKMTLRYDNKMSLDFNAETIKGKKAKVELKIENMVLEGKISTDFYWIKDVTVKGEIKQLKSQTEGSFSINYDKLQEPLQGKISYKTGLTAFELDIETPLSKPLNKIVIVKTTKNGKISVEIRNDESAILVGTVDRKDLSVELNIPKQILDLQLTLNVQTNFDNSPYTVMATLKSNLLQEINVKWTMDSIDKSYLLTFANPSKQGTVSLKISPDKTSLRSEYNGKITAIELEHELTSLYSFNGKMKVSSNMYPTSPMNFEIACKHSLQRADKLSLSLQIKWNDKIAIAGMVDYKKTDFGSFEFKSRLFLAPYIQEYESKLTIVQKYGEEFSVVYTPMGDSPARDITVRLVTKNSQNVLSIDTPYEIIRTVRLSVNTEYPEKVIKRTIKLDSNYLGKFELVNEHTKLPDSSFVSKFRLTSPYTVTAIQFNVEHLSQMTHKVFDISLEITKNVYAMKFEMKPERLEIQIKTPTQLLRTAQLVIEKEKNDLRISSTYNDYVATAKITYNGGQALVEIKTNTDYAKQVSLSYSASIDEKGQQLFDITLRKDDNSIKIRATSKDDEWRFKLENTLLPIFSNNVEGNVKYSKKPLTIVVDIAENSESIFKLRLNEKEFLIDARKKVSEFKLQVTKSRLEMIVLNSKLFSVLISQPSKEQIDIALMLNDSQYSTVLRYVNVDDKFQLKITSHRNSLDKLFEFYVDILSQERQFDSELNVLMTPILKLKLSDRTKNDRKFSTEIRLLYFTGIFDFAYVNQRDLLDYQIFWNIKVYDQQLAIGSITTTWKTSRPINYSVNVNVQSGAYKFQISELEDKQFKLTLATPIEEMNVEMKVLLVYNPDSNKYRCELSVKNKLIGNYHLESEGVLTRDPEMRLSFSTNKQILKIDIKMLTSSAEKYFWQSNVKFLNWEKFEVTLKLEMKDDVKVFLQLKTPCKLLKQFTFKKTLWFNSVVEHRLHTVVEYVGVVNVKYVGGHEISYIKRIIKYDGDVQSDESKIFSLYFRGSKDKDELSHFIIVDVKRQRYGYKIKGKFNPMFEGVSEIYTPFHSDGTLILQGKQMKNGIKIQAGKGNQEFAAFEYSSNQEVTFMRITPPKDYWKPVATKFTHRRSKRSVDDQYRTEITYGNERLLKFDGKVSPGVNKNTATFKIAAPIFSKKSAELKLTHQYKDGTTRFEHYLKIKDIVDSIYKIIGEYFQKDHGNFKYTFDVHHPNLGPFHFTMGHNTNGNTRRSNVLIKTGDKMVFLHNGKLIFEAKKINGELEIKMPNQHHQFEFSHDGNLDKFLQTFASFYNTEKMIEYKANIDTMEKSVIEIDLPIYDKKKLQLIFDKKENKANVRFSTNSDEYQLELVNNDGLFKMSTQFNNEIISSAAIGYGTKPLSLNVTYKKYYLKLQAMLKESVIVINTETNYKNFKSGHLRLTKNKIIMDGNYNNEPISFSLEYHFIPNNFFIVMETSLKRLSKVAIYVNPSEIKINLNEYFKIIRYILRYDNIMIDLNNNMFLIKTFKFNVKFDKEMKRLNSELKINEFVATSELSYSNNKLLLTFDNNQILPKSVNVELSGKSESELELWFGSLTIDKVEIFKLMAQKSKKQYSTGLKTSFGVSVVLSYDEERNEFIMSLKNGEKYFNLIGREQTMTSSDSKTIVINASIDSSCLYLRKATSQISYATSKKKAVVSFSGDYNNEKTVGKMEMTDKFFKTSITVKEKLYSLHVNVPHQTEMTIEVITPFDKVSITAKNIVNQYSLIYKHNEIELLKIIFVQNSDLKASIEHSSKIWYRNQNVWEFEFKTDFKVYEIQMKQPRQLEIILTNKMNKNGHTFGILTKYYYHRSIEKGFSVTFNPDPLTQYLEVSIENTFHRITLLGRREPQSKKEVSGTLLNKLNNDQWIATMRTQGSDEFEVICVGPKNKNVFKFIQIIKNGLKDTIEIELLNGIKLLLKRNEKSKLLIGKLTLFSKDIARVESSPSKFKVLINENGSENDRFTLEMTTTIQGEWKKNYLSTRRLILKQSALKINFEMEQEIKMDSKIRSFKTNFKYQRLDGTTSTMDLATIVDFSIADTITIQITNPIIPLKTVLKRQQLDKSSLRYDMDTTLNIDDKITGFLELSVGAQFGVTSKLYYNPENRQDFVQIHAKYLDNRQVEILVASESKKDTTNFFWLLFRLLNEHNLETTFQYQSNSFDVLISKIKTIKSYLTEKIIDFQLKQVKSIVTELQDRYTQMIRMYSSIKVIYKQSFLLLDETINQLKSFSSELDIMIMRNEFFLYSIKTSVERTVRITYRVYRELFQTATCLLRSIDLEFIFRQISQFTCRVYGIAWMTANSITAPFKMYIMSGVDYYTPKFFVSLVSSVESIIKAVQEVNTFAGAAFGKIREMRKLFILTEAYRMTVRLTEFVRETFGSLVTGSVKFLDQEKELKIMYDNLITKLETVSTQLMDKLMKVTSGIDEKLYAVTGDRYIKKLHKMVADFTDYVITLLKDEASQKIVKDLIKASIEEPFTKINSKISVFLKNIIIPRFIIFDRKYTSNSFAYTMTVTFPIPMNDLKSIPDLSYITKKTEEIKDIVKTTKKLANEKLLSSQKFLEFLRWFTPHISIRLTPSFVPEFESYATILRSSLVTFDKKSLQLQSKSCKVILAKDMRFKKWEILLEQIDSGRQYTVIVGENRITISMQDSKVSVNGKYVELPLSIGTTKIVAFGSVLKMKDDLLGLSITVDPINDMFTVGISGWYHGKVRGLFGTNDNEPFNDMLDIDSGKILAGKEFFKTYSNGGEVCETVANTQTETEDNKSCPFLRKIACKFIFKCPFSPMAACFNKINPRRFFKECVSSSDEFVMQMDHSVCQSARQYQTQCAAAGVKVQVPIPCRKCDVKGDNSISINEVKNIKVKEKVADIVFVIDEGKCLKDIRTALENIIGKLDENLREKGITSTRFGLVAFRGDGMDEAHTHTLNQKLFGTKDELLSSVKSLQWTEQIVGDAFGAIKLASAYPFREYSSKHIVLINCERCEDSSNQFKSVAEILDNNAIQFSIMIDYDFQVKDGDSKKMIFGVDSKKIYTTIAWRGEVSTDVSRPIYDYCYELTMRRQGVVFNVKYLSSKTDATQRRFVETFATQVSLTVAPARTATCKCYDDGVYNCVPLDMHTIFPIKKST